MFRMSWFHWSFLAVLVCLVGCGPAKVELAPATGVVTLDNAPLEGATVSFSPKGSGDKIAMGKTDASGRFTLNTPGEGDGAVPGSYEVSITKSTVGAAAAFEDPRGSGKPMTAEQQKQMMDIAKRGMAPGNITSEVPVKYSSPKTSGFTAEVKAGGTNEFTFPMTR